MQNNNLKRLEERKQALELEINRLQTDIDSSIESVKDEVAQNLDPREIIKKYPLRSLGVSLIVGMMFARSGKKNNVYGTGMGSMLSLELKRMITQRGVSLLGDFVDNKISSKRENKD